MCRADILHVHTTQREVQLIRIGLHFYSDTTLQTIAAVHDSSEEWHHLSLHEVTVKTMLLRQGEFCGQVCECWCKIKEKCNSCTILAIS